MRFRKLLQDVTAVTHIRPGDALVFRVPSTTNVEQLHQLHEKLESRLPDLEIIVVAGIDGIDVLREVAP